VSRHQRTPNPWIEHLYNTFSFFVENSDFNALTSHATFHSLTIEPISVASTTFSRLERSKITQNDEIIIPLIEIPIFDEENKLNEKIAEKHKGTFLIGGRMNFEKGKLVYYSFSICIVFATVNHQRQPFGSQALNIESCCLDTCKNEKRIIRRIHFDYQPKDHPANSVHMQIGGEFPRGESNFQTLHYCLDHFLERPRFPCDKRDFVSLFDYMIHEFETPLKKWRDDGQWKKLVDKSQELLKTLENT